jgi:hypothetical protein
MKNYKNIRQEPFLFGFNVKPFFVFILGSILGLMSFISGFSFIKLMITVIYILILYAICKYVLSNQKLINKIMDNKLPKEYSEYE